MNRSRLRLSLALSLQLVCAGPLFAQSQWAHLGPDGKLVYASTREGDRIPDFSYAGYEGGGVALPTVATKLTVSPHGKDDTAAIQSALDEVSALPLLNGFRGAVELKPGTYHCSGTLNIATSGVVLRGAGQGTTDSVLLMTGEPHLAVRVAGALVQRDAGAETDISDPYVPVGTNSVHVTSTKGFHKGDTVVLIKPVTAAWLRYMGMDDMHRKGKDEHWVSTDHLEVRRHVTAVESNTLTLDVPLMDDYDTRFFDGGHAHVRKVEVSGQISHVGLENSASSLHHAPFRSVLLSSMAS